MPTPYPITNILRELRYLPPNKMQEVLDFIRFLRQPVVKTTVRSASTQSTRKLLDFAGTLTNSPNFNGSPLNTQEQLRREWD